MRLIARISFIRKLRNDKNIRIKFPTGLTMRKCYSKNLSWRGLQVTGNVFIVRRSPNDEAMQTKIWEWEGQCKTKKSLHVSRFIAVITVPLESVSLMWASHLWGALRHRQAKVRKGKGKRKGTWINFPEALLATFISYKKYSYFSFAKEQIKKCQMETRHRAW